MTRFKGLRKALKLPGTKLKIVRPVNREADDAVRQTGIDSPDYIRGRIAEIDKELVASPSYGKRAHVVMAANRTSKNREKIDRVERKLMNRIDQRRGRNERLKDEKKALERVLNSLAEKSFVYKAANFRAIRKQRTWNARLARPSLLNPFNRRFNRKSK